MASSAYFLLLDIWQRLLLHSRATFGLKEEAVETLSLSRAWRCSSVSLDLYLDLLKFKEGREELFAQVCAPKKINGPLKHSGKLREAGGGGQFFQKLPGACRLFLSPPWTWLWVQSYTAGQWAPFEAQEGQLAHQKFEMCLCSSWSLQFCVKIPSLASTYSSTLNGVPASMSALHAGKWQRFVWESWSFHNISFVENALTLS